MQYFHFLDMPSNVKIALIPKPNCQKPKSWIIAVLQVLAAFLVLGLHALYAIVCVCVYVC